MKQTFLHQELTEKVIKCFYRVYDGLGPGFLESVYENSLMIELGEAGLGAITQKSLSVYYKDRLVGDFKADIVVEDKIIIEIKAVSKLAPQHEAQLINYLKATNTKIGLLVNFGDSLEFKRRIY